MAPIRSITVTLTAFVGPPSSSTESYCRRSNFNLQAPVTRLYPPCHYRASGQGRKAYSTRTTRSQNLKLNAVPPLASISIPKTTPGLGLGLGVEALTTMSLLALQFGLQPSLTRKFTPKNINRSTVVFTQDVVKFFMAFAAINITKGWSQAIVGKLNTIWETH